MKVFSQNASTDAQNFAEKIPVATKQIGQYLQENVRDQLHKLEMDHSRMSYYHRGC